MWFKNVNTGLEWLILDEKKIEEMKKNLNFVEIEKPIPSKNKSEKEKTSNKRSNPKQTKDIECEVCGRICKGQRSYTQHQRMAHGIQKKKDGDKK